LYLTSPFDRRSFSSALVVKVVVSRGVSIRTTVVLLVVGGTYRAARFAKRGCHDVAVSVRL
jgi:hypothetical protein